MKIFIKLILMQILLISIKTNQIVGQISLEPYGYKKLDSTVGSVLYSKTIKETNDAYSVVCQIIDLNKVKLSNFIELSNDRQPTEGKYLAQIGYTSSPYFKTFDYSELLSNKEVNEKNKLIGLIGGVFFEEFNSSTQLAFPLKNNGKIVSAGSSPNGPCDYPRNPIFKNIKLKALVWSDSIVSIEDYDPSSGYPMSNNEYNNGFVSYNWSDHPARLLRPMMKDRFLVMGTLNSNQSKGDNLLVIMIVKRVVIDVAEALLREVGVKGSIITLGGSASAFIYNNKKGLVEAPGIVMGPFSNSPIKIPHYFIISKK